MTGSKELHRKTWNKTQIMQIFIQNKWNCLNTFPHQFYQVAGRWWVMQKKENTIIYSNRFNSNVWVFLFRRNFRICEGRQCVTHIKFCSNSRKLISQSWMHAALDFNRICFLICLMHAKAIKSIKQYTLMRLNAFSQLTIWHKQFSFATCFALILHILLIWSRNSHLM